MAATAAAPARRSLPPSGSHSNRPLRMTLQAGPTLRKRGGLRAHCRKGGAGRGGAAAAARTERWVDGGARAARPVTAARGGGAWGRAAGGGRRCPPDRGTEAAPAAGRAPPTVVSRESTARGKARLNNRAFP